MWFKQTKRLTEDKGLLCPNHYCRECNHPDEDKVTCKFDMNNQCEEGRKQTSFLCSECEQGKFLAWGSEKCSADTSGIGTVLLKITLFLVCFASIFFVIVFSNIDVYESYLGSVIFFYQVAQLFLTITQDYHHAIGLIFGLCSFEGIGKTDTYFKIYLGSRFKEYWKPTASLGLIIFAVVSLYGAIQIRAKWYSSKYKGQSNLKAYLIPNTEYRAVVFLIVYLYGALIQICMNAISLIHIDGEFRLYIEASSVLSDFEKLVIFVIWIIIFGLAFAFPFFIIFQNCCLRECKCTRMGNDFFKHLCHLFKAPFRNENKWGQVFPCYYMIIGNAIKITQVIMTLVEAKKQSILTVNAIFSVFFLLAFTLTKPYTKKAGSIMSLNIFDAVILFVLCSIGVISNGKQKISKFDEADTMLNNVVRFLLWCPVAFCVLLNVARFVSFVVWLRTKKADDESFWHALKRYLAGGYGDKNCSGK